MSNSQQLPDWIIAEPLFNALLINGQLPPQAAQANLGSFTAQLLAPLAEELQNDSLF